MLTTQFVEIKLVYAMAHALRHDPAKYGLEPDAEGWVAFDDLIIAIRNERRDGNIEHDDIVDPLAAMESDRFEIAGAKIRAVYGHSIIATTHFFLRSIISTCIYWMEIWYRAQARSRTRRTASEACMR
jgi:RNA:NAD 2'-phosphotransferase (TPT1/KptA family)